MAQFQQSRFRIRLLIGILGISLPILLPILADWDVISSISHYYYLPEPSLYFIIVLSSLAIFLISYKGYKRDDDEFLNDDILTNIAGICALIVVIIPTACSNSGNVLINELCKSTNPCKPTLLGHNDEIKAYWHFGSAALFVFLMGYMSFVKFPRGENRNSVRWMVYKACGILIWSAIAVLGISYWAKIELTNIVFWMEAVAVWSFGISWLVKGKPIEATKQFINSFSKH